MANEKNVKVEVARTPAHVPENTYSPIVDVYEADDRTILVAEMPGVNKEDVRVEVDKGTLTIAGRTSWAEPSEKYGRTYLGFAGGEFFRAFALSDAVDRDKIAANMTEGVLTLTLPKAQAAKTRKIEIQQE